jgi:hypothetical protein
MTTEYAERIIQIGQSFLGCQIAAIRQETICLQQASRADKLIGVPPERWAAG